MHRTNDKAAGAHLDQESRINLPLLRAPYLQNLGSLMGR